MMKVMEGLPNGEIKDDYHKLFGVVNLMLKKPEERQRAGDE